jgi:hypothetical protein
MKHMVILLVALTMMVKPLWPIMEYVNNYDYISNVLCENKDKPQLQCNGKCYLAKLLEQEQNDQDKNPFGEQRSKAEVQHVVYFESMSQIDLGRQTTIATKNSTFYYQGMIVLLLTADITHPPELT